MVNDDAVDPPSLESFWPRKQMPDACTFQQISQMPALSLSNLYPLQMKETAEFLFVTQKGRFRDSR
jgi:hypothetical protein